MLCEQEQWGKAWAGRSGSGTGSRPSVGDAYYGKEGLDVHLHRDKAHPDRGLVLCADASDT